MSLCNCIVRHSLQICLLRCAYNSNNHSIILIPYILSADENLSQDFCMFVWLKHLFLDYIFLRIPPQNWVYVIIHHIWVHESLNAFALGPCWNLSSDLSHGPLTWCSRSRILRNFSFINTIRFLGMPLMARDIKFGFNLVECVR